MTLLKFCPQIKNILIYTDKFQMPLILRDVVRFDSKLVSSPYVSYSPITVCTDRL